eukprot:1924100-Prymnesium_polylepis.1
MCLACVSLTDQGTCAGLSRWGAAPSCKSGPGAMTRSLDKFRPKTARNEHAARRKKRREERR